MEGAKKNPQLLRKEAGDFRFYPRYMICRSPSTGRLQWHAHVQAGLLAPGSSYRPRPSHLATVAYMRLSFPVTAAGPLPVCTGFP